MSTPDPRPAESDVFDHLRAEDGEHVGDMEITADGGFVPYDLLWQRRGEARELDEAESVVVAHTMESMSGQVATTIDLLGRIEIPLPTDRLRPADAQP